MGTDLAKMVVLYKINFFQPKTQHDRNVGKEPLIITKETYEEIKEDLINNKRFEINDELYNPFTVDTVKKFKMEESVTLYLEQLEPRVKEKVKYYMKYDKKDLDLSRLQNMIDKAKEDLHITD